MPSDSDFLGGPAPFTLDLGGYRDASIAPDVDERALVCRYCGCEPSRPCVLTADSSPAPYELNWQAGEGREEVYPCGWHRVVELVDAGGKHQSYFAVCTNAECVKGYLADSTAP